MAQRQLENIFLSASIPMPERDEKYFGTCDVIAIRDATIALATTVLPHYRLIWGGHPSITPLIYHVMQKLDMNIQRHFTLYQSEFFREFYPEDNEKFENVIQVPSSTDRKSSLKAMREQMIGDNQFRAGIFIGGMEGVEEELQIFLQYHTSTLVLPIASTGAAAQILHQKGINQDERLATDYAYSSLFRDYLLTNPNLGYGQEGIHQL